MIVEVSILQLTTENSRKYSEIRRKSLSVKPTHTHNTPSKSVESTLAQCVVIHLHLPCEFESIAVAQPTSVSATRGSGQRNACLFV